MTLNSTPLSRLGWAALAGWLASITPTNAQDDLETFCAALAEARALIVSPGAIRLGDANDVMNTIAGLSAESLRLDSCEEQSVALMVSSIGNDLSYYFEFEELQNPDIWCGFRVARETTEIDLPYCRGK